MFIVDGDQVWVAERWLVRMAKQTEKTAAEIRKWIIAEFNRFKLGSETSDVVSFTIFAERRKVATPLHDSKTSFQLENCNVRCA